MRTFLLIIILGTLEFLKNIQEKEYISVIMAKKKSKKWQCVMYYYFTVAF